MTGLSVDDHDSRSPVGRPRGSLSSLLPVALLLSFIAFHGFQIIAHHDDAQRGGAFAMFATVDVGATRKLLATADDGSVELEVPTSLDSRQAALLDRPTEDSAKRFALLLRDLTWTVDGSTATHGGAVTFGRVKLQVVGLVADGRTIDRQVLVDVVVGPAS